MLSAFNCIVRKYVLLGFIFASCTTLPDISISPPKVYDDDQARRVISQRSRDLSAVIQGIQANTLQEIRGTTESISYGIRGSFSPPGLSAASMPFKNEAAPIVLTPIQKRDSSLGLSYTELLRQRISQDQTVMNYELLYEGDQRFLDSSKRLVIIRYDISIQDYVDTPSLAILRFTLFMGDPADDEVPIPKKDDTNKRFLSKSLCNRSDESQDVDLEVYTVGPEYISRVSQESLLTSLAHSYEGQGGMVTQAGNIQLAGQYLSDLQEAFISVAEQPSQFAMYSPCPNQFLAAFGPRRSIEKRSWINPARIFGNTYEINYRLEPGPRSIYAILVIPKEIKKFYITTEFPNEYVTYREFRKFLELYDRTKRNTWGSVYTLTDGLFVRTFKDYLDSSKRPLPPPASIELKDLTSSLDSPYPPVEPEIWPTELYPALPNTFLVTSINPVSAATQVFIGPLGIPKSNVVTLNRYRLLVTVNQDLSLAIYNNAMVTDKGNPPSPLPFEVRLLTPSVGLVEKIGTVNFNFTANPIPVSAPKGSDDATGKRPDNEKKAQEVMTAGDEVAAQAEKKAQAKKKAEAEAKTQEEGAVVRPKDSPKPR